MKQSAKDTSASESSVTEVPTYLAEAVIARFVDGMEDLRWVCVRDWRFGRTKIRSALLASPHQQRDSPKYRE